MKPMLESYLELERIMRVLDELGDPTADALRDIMDPLWYRLSPEERQLLDQRSIGDLRAIVEIRLPLEEGLFSEPIPSPSPRPIPDAPVPDWKRAA